MPNRNSTCNNLPFGGPATLAALPDPFFARGASHPFRAAAAAGKPWQKSKLKVAFLNNDSWTNQVKAKVKAIVPLWTECCAMEFSFDDVGTADALINVLPRPNAGFGTYQSYLGIDSLQYSTAGNPSMDLVFDPNEPSNDDEEFRRVILHEFGHLLGMIHEHARPDRIIQFDDAATVRYFQTKTGWSPEMIRQQVIQPYQGQLAGATVFDPKSIMMYPFPPGLATFLDGSQFSSGWNRDLTDLDKTLASQLYGAPIGVPSGPSPGTSTKVLTLNAHLANESWSRAGQRQRYTFTLGNETVIALKTQQSSQILTGDLLGPDGETFFLTLTNDADFTNLYFKTLLQPGTWTAEIWLVNRAAATGTFELSVTAS